MSLNLEKSENPKIKYKFLKAEKIIPKDDTYHGNIKLLDIEWWYFDAIFDNGYSIQIGFRTYHIKGFGIVQSRINVYKNGKPISEQLKIDLISNFHIDQDYPNISINNNNVIEFNEDNYKKNKKWEYKIKLSIKDTTVDLLFVGNTLGWKIETSDTCWTVPLPKAIVKGKIKIKGEETEVKGIGYHDHNWSYSPTTAMNNYGWYWGRTSADTMNITWAKVIHSKENIDILAVINKDEGGFYNIKPENIEIITKNYEFNNRGKIPKIFNLNIKDTDTNNIKIDCQVKMIALDIQYTRIFTIKYWRYHVKTDGTISIGNYSEKIQDKPQIIEYLKFKAKNLI
jgi:predicted secreted hydrolase